MDRNKRESEDFIFLAAGILMMFSELLKQLVLTFIVGGGSYQWWYFPWQLCSMPMYICILIYISGRLGSYRLRTALLAFLADFTLLSGIAAFFDTSGFHYSLPLLTAHSYLWHILLIALGIYAGTRKRDRSIKAYFPAAGIYSACAAAAEFINLSLDRYGTINMFYINPHYYMGQIVFRDLTSFMPNNAVIGLYIAATAAGGFIFHIIWSMVGRLRDKE